MTGTEVLAKVNSFGDISINNTTGLIWMDSLVKELSPDVGTVTTLEYATVEADTAEDLPADFGTIVDWLYEDEEYSFKSKIKIRENNKIYFPYDLDESIYLLYRAVPDYAALSTEIPLNPMVHTVLWMQLVSWYWDQEGEGDMEESINMAERWSQKYEIALLKAKDKIENRANDDVTECVDAMPRRARDHHSPWSQEDDYFE